MGISLSLHTSALLPVWYMKNSERGVQTVVGINQSPTGDKKNTAPRITHVGRNMFFSILFRTIFRREKLLGDYNYSV